MKNLKEKFRKFFNFYEFEIWTVSFWGIALLWLFWLAP